MFNKHNNKTKKDGVILLLVVVILTAIFSISIGVFSVIIGQVSISETFENSSLALYAADQGIEQALYRDRSEHDFGTGTTDYYPAAATVASGGCTHVVITKTTVADATITVTGLSAPCGIITERTVARAFLTTY